MCLTLAGTAPGQNLAERRERALSALGAVARGDREAAAAARVDLEAVLAAHPDDARARVHYGWLIIQQAWGLTPFEARAAALAGCAEMDVAVAAAPDDPEVRIVRARSDAQVPRILGREGSAEKDFAWLVAGVRSSVVGPTWPDALRREILFQAGAFALRQRRPAHAVSLLEEVAGIMAAAPSDEDVQSMLALARRELSSQGHAESTPPDQAQAAAP